MAFPLGPEIVTSTFGYHPLDGDVRDVVAGVRVAEALVLGGHVPDVTDLIGDLRYADPPPVRLPRGIYWFAQQDTVRLLVVVEGLPSADAGRGQPASLGEDHPLCLAADWLDALWEEAAAVPRPAFAHREAVVTVPGGQDTVVLGRRFAQGTWLYDVRVEGRRQQLTEGQLAALPDSDDPVAWVQQPPSPVERFAATLTRAKLEGALTDTVFSFRATRTLFRPYQFRPVMTLLQTGKSRLLVADEVGLGKTIEAGLIWTELEARHAANRVLVVCPSGLVAKWRREMDERFGFDLEELDNARLDALAQRLEDGRPPGRFAYVCSLERLRRWPGLEPFVGLAPEFDVVIVDEAHSMRNAGTRSNDLGGLLSDWADALVLLSATPLNLGNRDLFNLLELLTPGEFGDAATLETVLQPNAVLHEVGRTLTDDRAGPVDRRAPLHQLDGLALGPTLRQRPEYDLLLDVLDRDPLSPADVAMARRLLADLNALSALITRTRKADIDEAKAIRSTRLVQVEWSDARVPQLVGTRGA